MMSVQVMLSVGLVVVMTVANSISWKTFYTKYDERYSFFANQASILIYSIMAWSWTYYRALNGLISKKMLALPRGPFIVMGMFDGIACVLASLSSTHTPGQFQIILDQLAIPVCLIGSYVYLKRKYGRVQVFGALVIVCGTLVTIVPEFVNGSTDESAQGARWYAVLLYAISLLPTAANTVYMEKHFKDDEEQVDVVLLAANVSTFSFLFGFLFCPLTLMPGFNTGNDPSEILNSFYGGLLCTLGVNSPAALESQLECNNVWMYLVGYSVVYFVYTVSCLHLYKVGSALMAALATALAMPLTHLVFAVSFVMGAQAEPFSVYGVFGLVIVCSGFLLYSSQSNPVYSNMAADAPIVAAVSTMAGGTVAIADDSLPYHHHKP